jgi:predicted  nucleic acid-binding Zn-ribbon protein
MADKDIIKTLQDELGHLAEVRDELRVQLSLAKAELSQEWDKLENNWTRVQGEIKRLGDQTKEPAHQIGHATSQLVDELKRGYERIRAQIKR